MPDLDTVIDAQARRQGRSEERTAVRRPFAVGRVGRIDRAHLAKGAPVENVYFPSKVAKACEREEPALRIE